MKAANDVIVGILRRPYNFGAFHCRKLKFGNMIYLDVLLLKMSLSFKFKASMTSLNDVIIGSLQRPCNFDVSQCIYSKFSDMSYFDLFCQK